MPEENNFESKDLEILALRQRVRQLESQIGERLRDMLESSPMGMHLYELQPDNRLVFVGANAAANHILGVDHTQFVGKTIEEAFPPLAETEIPQHYRRVAAEGDLWQTEQVAYQDAQIAGAYQVYAVQTAPRFMAAVFMDITERKQAEDEIARYSQQQETLNQIGQTVVASLELDTVLEQVINAVPPLVGAEGVSILLLESSGELFFAAASGDLAARLRGQRIPTGKGVAGQVIKTRQPVMINDAGKSKQIYREATRGSGYLPQSILAVPLTLGGELVGVMEAIHSQPAAFDAADLRALELAATWAMIAMNNARQHETIQRRLQESQALASISQALNETTDLEQVLRLILDSARQVVPNVEKATIHLLASDGVFIEPVAVSGGNIGVPENGIFMRAGEGVAGYVIDSGNTVNIHDTVEDDRFIQRKSDTHIRSMLVAPIQRAAYRLGTISLTSTHPNAFSSEDENLLTVLGVQAALAIQNTRLFTSTRRRLQEVNTLYQINNLIMAAPDPDVDAILSQVVDLLWRNFGYYHVHVYLFDQKSQALIANQGSGPIGAALKAQGFQLTSEEGIVGYVAALGEPFMTNDVSGVHFHLPNPLLPETSAELAAPLRARNQILGVLDILHRQPNAFDDNDFRFATNVADQIAAVLDKAMLYKELQTALEKEQSTRAQLVQTEKLAAMGRLVASVAHELNNPLQAIQNALYLIRLEESLTPQAEEDLQVAIDEGARMAGLISRLRETYRPTSAADYEPESIAVLVDEVQKLLATHLRHSAIQCHIEIPPDLPPVPMIRDQIKQVIINLYINAIEGMPNGGRLYVQAGLHPDLRSVCLNVTDTGPGIPAHYLERIFEPFFTTKEGGTGLGLAVSYEIVQNHGGSLEVRSEIGQGATFTLCLPMSYRG